MTAPHASLGPAVGAAYVATKGMATVYATETPNLMTLQIDATGERFTKTRQSITWRKPRNRKAVTA